jgi:hypothetical protein
MLQRIHSWAATRNGRFYRILCPLLRIVILKREGAPRSVVDGEWKTLKERLGNG